MKHIDDNNGPIDINPNPDTTAADAGLTPFVVASTLSRAQMFLGTLGTDPSLRTTMQRVGYTDAVHTQGWKLLFLANGGNGTVVTNENVAALAVSSLENWEELGFARVQNALEHEHPDQAQFVFGDGLTFARGFLAVGQMALFLDRLDALESSPERKSTRKADHAALATLAERGIDARLRKQLRTLVEQASTDADATPIALPESVEQRRKAQLALFKWLRDWSGTARVLFRRQRGVLIALGLAKRRSRKEKVAPAANPPVVVTPPPPPPVAGPEPPPIVPVVTPDAPVVTPVAPVQTLHAEKEELVPPSRAA